MMRQYDLLNKCLKELRASSLPAYQRLTVEVLLIQIKRILLCNEVKSRVAGNAESEQEFLGLYDRIERICGIYRAETDMLILHLEKLKDGLSDGSEAKRTGMGPADLGLQILTRAV